MNQDEKLASARKSAADGYLSSYTIPLLAEPETLVQTAKLNWVLRFPLPPPNPHSTRRFSATPSYNHGPRTPQALDGAIRFASSFTYDTPPVPFALTSSFLQLPDPVSRFGEVRRPTAGPFPPPPQDIQDWLNAGAIRLHTHDEYKLPGANLQGLPPSIEKCFFGQISLDQSIALLDNAPTDSSALQHAVQDFRSSKRARIDLASIPVPPTLPLSPPPSHSLSPHAPSPFRHGPACHCGWSRLTTPLSRLSCPTTFSYFPFLSHSLSPRPGLSLWLVPPYAPSLVAPPHLLPFPFRSPGPACHCGRSRRLPPLYSIYSASPILSNLSSEIWSPSEYLNRPKIRHKKYNLQRVCHCQICCRPSLSSQDRTPVGLTEVVSEVSSCCYSDCRHNHECVHFPAHLL